MQPEEQTNKWNEWTLVMAFADLPYTDTWLSITKLFPTAWLI